MLTGDKSHSATPRQLRPGPRHSRPRRPRRAVVTEVASDDGTTILTPETYARLQEELEDLTTRGRVEIAQAIEAARALGDLSENGDYHAAKDTQGKMEARSASSRPCLSPRRGPGSRQAADGTVAHGHGRDARYEGATRRHPGVLRRLHRGAPRRHARRLPDRPARPGPARAGRRRRRRVRSAGRPLRVESRGRRADGATELGRDLAGRGPSPRRSGSRHVVRHAEDEPDLLFIDLHLVHEVTSPQAFDGLRIAGRTRAPARPHRRHRRPQRAHHRHRQAGGRRGVGPATGDAGTNCAEFGITCYPMGHGNQGIVHVIGPELGLTQPGMTIVCGDSHTSTHGAFGALAFGIGTTEVEHVLATQTLPQARPATMAVEVDGELPPGSPPRTSCSPSSAASAPAVGSATSSSTAARPSRASRWKAA